MLLRFILFLINLFFSQAITYSNNDLLDNKLNLIHVPIRESELLTRNRIWPNFNGIGCIASDKSKSTSYLFTSTEHFPSANRACNEPPRQVEVIKINLNKRYYNYSARLYKYSNDCTDIYYSIKGNLQLCNLVYQDNTLIQNNVRSILVKQGQKLKIITDCSGNQNNIYRILDNTNSTEDKCFEVNNENDKFKNAEFSHNEWMEMHLSNYNISVVERICIEKNYIFNPNNEYNNCNIPCCMINYKNIGYIRFITEPNPMIEGRLLIGDSSKYDSILEKQYQGNLGSDMIRTCGIDTEKNILFYIGSNVFNCPSSSNTDSSIVRINLDNFTFKDRIYFHNLNYPIFNSNFNKFYNNPTSSIVDTGKYIYLTFYYDYSAIFKINISNIKLDKYIRPEILLDDDDNDLFTLKYFSQSTIDLDRRYGYFLHDPVNRGDTSILIRINLDDDFSSNSTSNIVKKLEGITGVSKMIVDKYTGILYLITGLKKPTRIYHFDNNLNKIALEDLCGQEFLELPTDRVIRNFDLDYKTGYIYVTGEFNPFSGVTRITSENLQYNDLNDSFPITVPYFIAKQHDFNHDNLLVNPNNNQINWRDLNDPNRYYYTELLNISSVFEDEGLTILATAADGPNLPYIFIMENFGCIPGRGLLNDQCTNCMVGFYSSQMSFSECYPCELGKSTNIEGSINCKLCETGKYTDEISSIQCKNCLAGFYSNSIGQSNCNSCGEGRYLASSGSKLETDCIICEEGTISSTGSRLCKRCEKGEYKDNINSCKKCPEGKYGSNIGVNNIQNCLDCPIGQYNDLLGGESINICKNCPSGRINSASGSVDNSTCKKCQKGNYRTSSMLKCTECPDGSISSDKSDLCELCPFGKYSNNGIFCIECDDGYYANNNGSSFCNKCSNGQISNLLKSVCIDCSPGFYENNNINCIKCDNNMYSSNYGSQTCSNCPIGRIVINNTNCISCKIGFYTDDNLECKKCQSGTYSDSDDSSKCNVCPNGYISSSNNDNCIPCPKGKYSFGINPEDHIVCIDCSIGKFSGALAGNSPTVCINCPSGKWSSILSLNNSLGCNECLPGLFSDIEGATNSYTCKSCLEGRYNKYYGAKKETDCIQVGLGTYSKTAAVNYIQCPKGKYSSTLGSSDCLDCPLGKYADEINTIYCKDCPENSEQSIDKTDWICSEGSFLNLNDSYKECEECPLNTFCQKGSTIETIKLNPGYWRRNKNSLNIIECRTNQYCKGGMLLNNSNICKEGHDGPLCDNCIKGYAKINGICEICPEENKALNIFLSIGFILIISSVLVFLIRTANDTENSRDEFSGVIKVLTNYLQVISLAKNFDIKWPEIIIYMFNTAETASGPSIQFYSTQCAIGWNYYQRFIVYLAMPTGYIFFVTFILSIIYCINKIYINQKIKTITPEQLNDFIKENEFNCKTLLKWFKTSTVVGLFLMYPTVIKNLLQIINCVEVDGVYYLNKDFSIECFQGEHLNYSYYSYIFIVIYGLGIPAAAFTFLYKYRNRLYSSNVVSSLKFLYIEYKPNRYYWEMVIMFRKIAIIFMSVFLFSKDTSRYQMIVASWLVQFCLFLQILYNPYDTITQFGKLCNKLEIMSLGTLVITLNSGIVFGTTKDNYQLGFFESIVSIIVLIINIIIALMFIYHIFITGSNKSKRKIRDFLKVILNSNKCKCSTCCKKSKEKLRRWSNIKEDIPHILSIYNIEKAKKYNEILNIRSKGTIDLDNYLEELRNLDKTCYNNLTEKLLKFHSDIELHQRNHVNSVIKYNKIVYDLNKFFNKNLEKDLNNFSIAYDLFKCDMVEHRNTIMELYNDEIKSNNTHLEKIMEEKIIFDIVNEIINKIEKPSSFEIDDIYI